MPVIPVSVARCCARLRDAGYAAHPVGGCVRDLLLGRVPTDWDVATSARPEQVEALFEHTVPTGLKHGTVTVLILGEQIEVTTFRLEGAYSDGRHPDTVSFDAGLTEDLARRDFTINAMALDGDESVIDPFGGQNDLAGKKIRCVGDPYERFREDALRMLRAVRLSAQLGFEIDRDTAAAMTACAGQIARVAVERVRVEMEKTITAPYPGRGNLFFSMGLLAPWLEQPVFPDLSGLSGLSPQPLYRWSGFCALLGSTDLLKRLKPDRRTAGLCEDVLKMLRIFPPQTDADWRRLLSRYGEQAVEIAAALAGRERELRQVLNARPCYEIGKLALTGRDLLAMGLRGPQIGAAQQRLLAHVLEHPEDNEGQTLKQLLSFGGE